MQTTRYGGRLAHGALILGFTSTASSKMIEFAKKRGEGFTPVALGYDGVRFVGPVFIGDTIKVSATIREMRDHPKRAAFGIVVEAIEIVNQAQEVVLVCEHLYLVERRGAIPAA